MTSDVQTMASRGPMVKAMLQKENGMGEVWLGAVALQSAKGCDQRGKVTVPYLFECVGDGRWGTIE
jgi:hypothetical protein